MLKKQFNKKNVKKFAKSLYYEKGDDIYYRPMCSGALAKANGELVGCILAELYEEFTGDTIARPLTEEEVITYNKTFKNYPEESKQILPGEYFTCHKTAILNEITEPIIINLLAGGAVLKDSRDKSRLIGLLDYLPDTNDSVQGETEKARIKRAKILRYDLEEIADELLA